MRLHGLIGFFCCLVSLPLRIQAAGPAAPNPVHWSAGPATTPDPHRRFQVPVHAAIDVGWHLYALPEADSFPLATEIAIKTDTAVDLLSVKQTRPRHTLDRASQVRTAWFEREATFTLQLRRRTLVAGSHALGVVIRYQVCNDQLCLPARTETLPVAIGD